MTIMRKFLIAVLAFACAALPASGQAVSADAEKALYELWQAHVAASNDHEQAYYNGGRRNGCMAPDEVQPVDQRLKACCQA